MNRILALALGLCLSASPAFAGAALIAGTGTNGLMASGSVNGSANITSGASGAAVAIGSLVYIAVTQRAGGDTYASTCSDSAGNTYSHFNNKISPGSQLIHWYWDITTILAPIGTTWTCNNASTVGKGIMVAVASGVDAVTPHDANSATPTSGTGTVMSVGPTGTLSCPGGGANCEILFAAWTNHNTGAQSAQTGGFTQFGCITTNFANECLGYEIVSASTAQSFTSTNANSDVWAMALDGFPAATGGSTNKTCTIAAVGGGTC